MGTGRRLREGVSRHPGDRGRATARRSGDGPSLARGTATFHRSSTCLSSTGKLLVSNARGGRRGAGSARPRGNLRRGSRRAQSSISHAGSPKSSPRARFVVCVLAGRGLEVPLRRAFWGGRWTSRSRWRRRSLVVVPARDPCRVARARRRRGAERVLRACSSSGTTVAERYVAGTQQARVAVPLRARGRPGGLVPRGRGV